MGGLALKHITRRFSKEEFEIIIPQIKEKLLTIFKKAEPTIYYKQKESFGDADFLCLIPNDFDGKIFAKILTDTFNCTEVHHVTNSPTWTFDYNGLQVDLILTEEENWESSLTYFSYNDLHNLIGKIAHGFGLKWGFDGLKYRMFLQDGRYLGDVYLTKNAKQALEFLGYDYERYLQGFNTIKEIMDYSISTKFFSKELFLLENLNRINRERDRKRKTYADFLVFIETLDKKDYSFFENKDAYLSKISDGFPNFYPEYSKLLNKFKMFESNREKFNANVIAEFFTELTMVQIGSLIRNFRNSFKSKDEMDLYIHQNDILTIINKLS